MFEAKKSVKNFQIIDIKLWRYKEFEYLYKSISFMVSIVLTKNQMYKYENIQKSALVISPTLIKKDVGNQLSNVNTNFIFYYDFKFFGT